MKIENKISNFTLQISINDAAIKMESAVLAKKDKVTVTNYNEYVKNFGYTHPSVSIDKPPTIQSFPLITP
jgi:hypothetical protein